MWRQEKRCLRKWSRYWPSRIAKRQMNGQGKARATYSHQELPGSHWLEHEVAWDSIRTVGFQNITLVDLMNVFETPPSRDARHTATRQDDPSTIKNFKYPFIYLAFNSHDLE
ncbi:hypothetical protein N7G274_010532 [Stereocaulon virgatum]|uniref:Uncharacterized protein n=1 Tax=Stereocaulon virgatum TaxID=373712 RepID=A0ABR3ZXE8_9LECA